MMLVFIRSHIKDMREKINEQLQLMKGTLLTKVAHQDTACARIIELLTSNESERFPRYQYVASSVQQLTKTNAAAEVSPKSNSPEISVQTVQRPLPQSLVTAAAKDIRDCAPGPLQPQSPSQSCFATLP